MWCLKRCGYFCRRTGKHVVENSLRKDLRRLITSYPLPYQIRTSRCEVVKYLLVFSDLQNAF